MHPQIDAMFDEAENRYLKPDELNTLNQYVESLPDRLETYRCLRDQEVTIMQRVAEQLEQQFPSEKIEVLERCLKNALLVMRYSAMGMLLNDELFLQTRLISWLEDTVKVFNTQTLDTALYRLLNQRLSETLTGPQLRLIQPHLTLAERALIQPAPTAPAL
ncbi:MAG: phycobilisome protein [Synechococcales bacterium]|nr:phycobilisome protein [Synechococcales bacterium]